MYTLFLIGIALALVLGFLFSVTVIAAITYGIVIFVYGPVFRAVDKTNENDPLTSTLVKLTLFALPIVISWACLFELWVVPLGITVGMVYGGYKLK